MEDVEDIYELAPMQHGMLFDSVTTGDTGMYLIQLDYFLKGSLRLDEFIEAWAGAFARHPILRTSFHWDELEKPLQVVQREVPVEIPCEDLSQLSRAEQDERVAAWRNHDREQGVDFEVPPLMRLALFRTGPESWRLMWSFHHILIEGWSASIVLNEVLDRYRVLVSGGELTLAEHRPYRDFVSWIQEQDPAVAEAYWRGELAGFSSPTHLGVDLAPVSLHAPVLHYDGTSIELSESETAALTALAQTHGLTMNTLVQGAWALMLSCYSGEDDVLFGTIVSGRSVPLKGADTMIGLFTNILPSRVSVPPEASLIPWLKDLQARSARQREFEHCPLVEVKAFSDVSAGLPLFESLLVFENWTGDLTASDWGGELTVADVHGHHGAPGHPLSAVIIPGKQLTLGISYDLTRFEGESVERILANMRALLTGMAADPTRCLAELPLLTDAERQTMVVDWNRTAVEPPAEACIQRVFERQAAATPDQLAVVQGDRSLTYGELDEAANRLAHLLVSLGAQPGERVGLCVERDLSTVVAMLAVLKAGAAYMPMDPAHPQERLGYLVEDCRPVVLLTQQSLASRFSDVGDAVHVICLDDPAEPWAQHSAEAPATTVGGDDPAYLIYTSGSTGRPKGVVVPHKALANYVDHSRRAFAMVPDDRMLQFASISFDAAAEEIYPTLLSGATLVLRNEAMLASVEDFLAACEDWKVTIIDFPTAFWHVVVDGLADSSVSWPQAVRLIILGGERAKPEQLDEWYRRVRPSPRVLNTYGPTESTIVATSCELLAPGDDETTGDGEANDGETLDEWLAEVPIGRPVSNAQVYVLDARGAPVPIGVPGELHVGGAGLATGYFERPELTAERFIPDPFSEVEGARLYRTGDLVRYRSDGELEFMGRIDTQVKYRGYRIELAEIEACLCRVDRVQEAVVLLREDTPGSPRLVAYVVARAPAPSDVELRSALGQELPGYMVPSAFMALDTLPLTPHGKVDRRALPAPDAARGGRDSGFVAPRNESERQVAEIWSTVLEVERVGAHDNFFDLGGHSLLLMTVIGEIRKQMGVRLTPGELVLPTVAQVAALCAERLAHPEQQTSGGLMGRVMRRVRRFGLKKS